MTSHKAKAAAVGGGAAFKNPASLLKSENTWNIPQKRWFKRLNSFNSNLDLGSEVQR